LRIHIEKKTMKYDGGQLCSHFAFRTFGIQGDSLVSFRGGMDIPPERIVDLEDLAGKKTIRGALLVHFIVEHFGITLEGAVLRQRLLVRLAADIIAGRSGQKITVSGDDLYAGKGKLSVSIAAPSPVSCLIHLGINITTRDVPVAAAALEDLGVDPPFFAEELCRSYAGELESLSAALAKVRGVP